MSKIGILKTSITSLETDALVNAANQKLQAGGGVSGIIFTAAGVQQLQAACDAIGGCEPGSAVITPGFNLRSKFIIHAVGPRWVDGKHKESKLLYGAYQKSLQLALENGCRSIGFPLISAGASGYPVDKAWKQAIQACLDFQDKHPEILLDILFAVTDDQILKTGKKTLAELKKETTAVYVEQLNDAGVEIIKQKIMVNSGMLLDRKAHPMSGGLLSILCEPDFMQLIDTPKLIRLVESIFPHFVLEEGWLSRYADILLRTIDIAKKNNKTDERAARYEKHLREILVPTLRAGSQTKDVLDDLETLEDIYKVAVCLLRYYVVKEEVFSFEVDISSMERLNASIQNVQGAGAEVFGLALVPVRAEDRQYAIFLSWVLEELLCDQEDLRRED